MKFAMTGHKGLIGSSLLERLTGQGDESILLVDKRDGKDILKMDKYSLSKPVDMMIHLASFCKINKCINDPEIPFNVNTLGTYNVLEFCRKHKIPKIVFTSSSRVLSPEKNAYTASKLAGEEMVKGYEPYGIEHVIIRPSTVYGPFNDETKRLIDLWMIAALKGEELKIYGNKNKTLDFTYVDDFVDGMMLAMNQKNEAYDLSGGQGVRISEVADMIISLAGKGTKKFYPAEIAQPQEVQLDISAIKKIGYEPKVGIEEGVKRTFDWYKENFDSIVGSR
jgi:UDP-glucose 4-epimerase